ncbi:MAG: hypothetical protein IPI88_07235 [Chitinophagaceae bacterium]|nr:hypothetical protein [Chitinophagaceae bacterium]
MGLRNANGGEEKKSQHLFFKFQTQSCRIKRHQVTQRCLRLGLMILLGTLAPEGGKKITYTATTTSAVDCGKCYGAGFCPADGSQPEWLKF